MTDALREFADLWDHAIIQEPPLTHDERTEIEREFKSVKEEHGSEYEFETLLQAAVMDEVVSEKQAATFEDVASKEIVGRSRHNDEYEEVRRSTYEAFRDLRVNRRGLKIGSDIAPLYACELDRGEEVVAKALELSEIYQQEGKDSGKSPKTVAASSVYAAMQITRNKDLTQKEIAEQLDMNRQTISKTYTEMIRVANLKSTG